MTSLCRQPTCALPIVWATTANGSPMPIDAEPNPAGNLAVWRDDTGALRCRVVTAEHPLNPDCERPGMPHWSTCRNPPPRSKAHR
jgi:hypothetical protein